VLKETVDSLFQYSSVGIGPFQHKFLLVSDKKNCCSITLSPPFLVSSHSSLSLSWSIPVSQSPPLCAGILEQSMGARNRVRLLRQPARARICKPFKELRNRFPTCRAGTTILSCHTGPPGYIDLRNRSWPP
jgi:hypothetical protein